MDHRWNRRVVLRTDVVLYEHHLPIATGKTENLSVNGLFIYPGLMEFARNACVEVEFELPVGGTRRRFRLPALVVRRSDRGIGLMFRALDGERAAQLQRFVHEQPPDGDRGVAVNS